MKKSVTLNNYQIEKAMGVFRYIKEQNLTIDALTMYIIVKNLKIIEEVFLEYQEARNNLIRKLGVQEGDTITVPKESEPIYFNELTPIANFKHELEVYTVPITKLANLHVTLDQQIDIDFMIEDDI